MPTPCCTPPRPPAVAAATVGTPCEDVDRAAREIIADAGFGEHFIHRTGHGIGLEEHEDPYIIAGNTEPLAAGHAFSVEPGIYFAGRWGIRLEDIVVATDAGPRVASTTPTTPSSPSDRLPSECFVPDKPSTETLGQQQTLGWEERQPPSVKRLASAPGS